MTDLLAEAVLNISFDALEDHVAVTKEDKKNIIDETFIEDFLKGLFVEDIFVYNVDDKSMIQYVAPMEVEVPIVNTEPSVNPEPTLNPEPVIIPETTFNVLIPVEYQDELRMSSISITEKYYCAPCDKSFKASGSYTQHCNTHHSDKKHRCKVCGKRYVTAEILNLHMKNHEKTAKVFNCDRCPKGFVHKVDLKRHKMKHDEIKPYNCSQCSKGFIRRDQFLRHQSSHQRKAELKIKKALKKAQKS